jgi:hemerythrin-like metal-binding protein
VTEVIEWRQEWRIGIAHLDAQHHRLVDLLADLQRQMNATGPRVSTLHALVALSAYIDLHFGDEEQLMRQINFPKREEHQAAHGRFVERVNQFVQAVRQGNTELSEEISYFLEHWIVHHIANSDVQIAAFIKAERIELTPTMLLPAAKHVD